ncbi:MAG TPA: glycosyltransferase [Steroidobacteraceae bacterium]|nr:glycosyltransferase [Steroidobacteraceae bacterium]
MKVCAVVPVYEHAAPAAGVVAALVGLGLPCIVVDDGSGPAAALSLARLARPGQVELVRHPRNRGKGAAVITGLRRAAELGFSHALQIDADGQHDVAEAPRLLAAAAAAPEAVVTGYPVYDASVPRSRYYGRYLSHVWVWINTLSRRIVDSMCGFRVYPIAPVLALIEHERVGERMDFDTEALVRLDWAGREIVNVPVTVRYPTGGVSHFRLWRDNLLISAMHARLFFGMLARLPRLLGRRLGRGVR